MIEQPTLSYTVAAGNHYQRFCTQHLSREVTTALSTCTVTEARLSLLIIAE